jgi:hypothetical protein
MSTRDIIRPIPNAPKLRPLPEQKRKKKYPVMGSWLVTQLCSSVNIRGRVGSGKSVIVEIILNSRCGPQTKVLIFSQSAYSDKEWLKIGDMLTREGIKHVIKTSIFDILPDGTKVNHIKDFIEAELKQGELDTIELKKWEEKQKGKSKNSGILVDDPYFKKEEKRPFLPTKDPYLLNVGGQQMEYCPWIIVLDDISSEMKNPWVTILIKQFRHYHATVILSSQSVTDSNPDQRQNFRQWFLFEGVSDSKLKMIHETIGSDLPLERFIERYHVATKEKYSFLNIDTVRHTMMIKNEAIFEEVPSA